VIVRIVNFTNIYIISKEGASGIIKFKPGKNSCLRAGTHRQARIRNPKKREPAINIKK
jgi:hypothetical protein